MEMQRMYGRRWVACSMEAGRVFERVRGRSMRTKTDK